IFKNHKMYLNIKNFSTNFNHITTINTIFNFIIFFFKQKTAYEIGLGIPAEPLFRSKSLETNNLFNNLIQRNQSAAFSSGKVTPNHETNINIIARRTGKDVNSHTVLDGIITTIMADRKSGSAGMPRPISYDVFCLKKKKK